MVILPSAESDIMAQFLPLFPLSLVVFPGEPLRLHIFEERYKQLTNECLDLQQTFGIPAVIENHVVSVATEVRISSLDQTYPTGEMDITVSGKRRVRVEHFFQIANGKLYPGGEVSTLEEDITSDFGLQERILGLTRQLHEVLGIQKEIVNQAAALTAFNIGHHIGLNLQQKFELLSLNKELDRLNFIYNHLQSIIPVVKETERLKAKAKLNGHYKNMIPPTL